MQYIKNWSHFHFIVQIQVNCISGLYDININKVMLSDAGQSHQWVKVRAGGNVLKKVLLCLF